MSFTKEQISAIETRNKNILVSAAAGSGKTTVLVERIIKRILKDKINVDNLLIVTFTNSAASEMKERIIAKINDEIDKNKNDEFLKEQLLRINKAQISTIDSFCLKIVKDNFKYLDIDPNFRIVDNEELTILKFEALENFLEKHYSTNNEKFINTLNAFSKKADDKSFTDLFFKVYEQAQNSPYPKEWLVNAYNEFNINSKEDFIKSKTFLKVVEYSKEYLNEISKISDFINYTLTGIKEDKLTEFLKNEFAQYDYLLKTLEDKNFSEFYNSIENLKFKTWPRNVLKDNLALKDEIKSLRDNCKEIIVKLKSNFYSKSICKIIEENKIIFPIMETFCQLVIEFDTYFMKIKKDKKTFTFNDISHFCLHILINQESKTPSIIAENYKNEFAEIILDEYQDSNLIQEEILSAISKENNRFMVGDIKQCIYRFRQANPKIFNSKYTGYFSGNLNGVRIELNANFRSMENVINSINFFFEKIMSQNFGEVDYDDNSRLYPKANFFDFENNLFEKNCELYIIDSTEEDMPEDINEQMLIDIKNTELEASFVAKKISDMKTKENLLVLNKTTNKYEPLEYKDIVILMRNNIYTEVFSKVLSEYNIPNFSKTYSGFFDFLEISTILNILKIIDNPLQDIALISVMYSPIFNFSANELLEIKVLGKSKLFYNCIVNFLNENDCIIKKSEYLSEKLNIFLEQIKKWQNISKTLSINELLSYIYEDSDYYNYVGLLQNGKMRQANLFKLSEKAITFENTGLRGIFAFTSYIEKIKNFNQDGDSNIISENDNTVRIMTIHKSKGLEFPVVFISGLHKIFNEKDTKEAILFDSEYMLGVSIFNNTNEDEELFSPRFNITSFQKELIKEKIKFETYSEELRILYVAFTRAKEKLILTGTVSKKFKDTLKKFETLVISSNLHPKKMVLPKFLINSSVSNNYLSLIYSVLKAYENESNWAIHYENKKSILQDFINTAKKQNIKTPTNPESIFDITTDSKYSKVDISSCLNWEYKYKIDKSLNTTFSVSEIKRKYQTKFMENSNSLINFDEALYNLPKFYKSDVEEMSPLKKGLIYHTVFENLYFNISNLNEIEDYLKGLTKKGILANEDIKIIQKDKIMAFLNSEIGNRIKNSPCVKREVPFRIGIPPYEIYTDKEFENSENLILVNGVIDLFFEEGDEIVLLDYKTDSINNINILKERYKIQLDIYKKALEKVTQKRVKECLIYSVFWENTIVV